MENGVKKLELQMHLILSWDLERRILARPLIIPKRQD